MKCPDVLQQECCWLICSVFIVRIDSVLYPCFINVSKIESMMTNFVLVDIDFPNLTLEYKFITQVYFCLDLISRLCLNEREKIKEKGENII